MQMLSEVTSVYKPNSSTNLNPPPEQVFGSERTCEVKTERLVAQAL